MSTNNSSSKRTTNSSDKTTHSHTHTEHFERFGGGRDEMLKVRAKQLPTLKKNIEEVLASYEGEPIVVIRVKDLGEKTECEGFLGGVGDGNENAALAEAMHDQSIELQKKTMPAGLGDLLSALKGSAGKKSDGPSLSDMIDALKN